MSDYSWARDDGFQQPPADKTHMSVPRIYTIYNISMDETSSSSRRASLAALKKSQRTALEKLFRKIIREEDHQQIPKLDDAQVMELVSGIEVANEKSSNIRYIADFTVHFSRDKIYNFLSNLKLPFAETLSNPVSILAVLEKDGATVMWDAANDWRTAWEKFDTVNNLVPINVIGASRDNRMAITAWQAQNGGHDTLGKFADLRGLRKLYVMSAHVENDLTTGSKILELRILSNGEDEVEFATTIVVEQSENNSEDLYNEAIKQATYWLDNQWKEKVMIHFGMSSHLAVTIKFDQSEDWFEIKKKLESISLIRKVVFRNFKTNSAVVEIEHSGDVKQIILTLDQEDLVLSEEFDKMNIPDESSWILMLKK